MKGKRNKASITKFMGESTFVQRSRFQNNEAGISTHTHGTINPYPTSTKHEKISLMGTGVGAKASVGIQVTLRSTVTMDGLLENIPKEKYNCDFNSNVPFYNLPPLIGYVGHDVTRPKAPAPRLCGRSRVIGSFEESPGPANYNARGMTRFGPAGGIKAKVIGRPRDFSTKEDVPGPGAYFPKSTLTLPSDPRPVLLGRPRELGSLDDSPGPANYSAEPALGYGLPRLPNSRAAIIKSRPREIGFYAESGPGPGKYTYDDKKFLRKSPAAPLGSRGADLTINKNVPAPNSYHPKTNAFKQRAPAFSFGRRQSKCMTVVIEEDDNDHYLEYECK